MRPPGGGRTTTATPRNNRFLRRMRIVRTNDTGTLQYDIHLNDDQSECIVHERYRDSKARIEHAAHLGDMMEAILATGSPLASSLVSPAQSSERRRQAARSVSSRPSCQCRQRSSGGGAEDKSRRVSNRAPPHRLEAAGHCRADAKPPATPPVPKSVSNACVDRGLPREFDPFFVSSCEVPNQNRSPRRHCSQRSTGPCR